MKISHILIVLLMAHILVMSQKLPCGTAYEFYKNTHPSLTGMSLIELDQSIAKRIAGKRLKKVQNASNDILRVPVVFHIFNASRSLPVTIGIFNISGNRIKTVNLKMSSSGLTIYMMDIAALTPGKYIVEMKTGTERYCTDFLKQ